MRISFVLSSFWLSGGTLMVIGIANRLAQRGHRVTIVYPGGSLEPDVAAEIDRQVNLRETPMPVQRTMAFGSLARLSWQLAVAVPPSDLVLSTQSSTTAPVFIAAHLLRRGRAVWFYQDYQEMFLGRPLVLWLARNGLRWHAGALAVSQYSREELMRGSPKKPVVVCGVAIDHPEIFQPLPASERLRDEQGRSTILYLGDMRPRKGWDDFLEAAEIVHKTTPEILLQIVSKEKCAVPGKIPHRFYYRPSRPELSALYASCDVFVSASWWESFGLPPLEAMACGAPVVLTDSRGSRDYARNRENCVVVPPRDPPALAAAILEVLQTPRLAAGFRRAGPPTAAQFTWERVIDQFEGALASWA